MFGFNRSEKPRKFMFEVIIIGKGTNKHVQFMREKLPVNLKVPGDETVYKVTTSDIFVAPSSFMDLIKRRPAKFLTIFNEGVAGAVEVKSEKITTELLYTAHTSDRVKMAISGMFKSSGGLPISARKMILVVIVIAVVAVVVLVATGRLNIMQIFGGKKS